LKVNWKRIRRGLLTFGFLGLLSAGFCQGASDAKQIGFKWKFRETDNLYYKIRQQYRAQSKVRDLKAQKWLNAPEHSETIDGDCMLEPLGDGNAHGMLILKLLEVKEGGVVKEQSAEQMLPQVVAQFNMNPLGIFDDYKAGTSKETFLLLRLIFGLPEAPLRENEGKLEPLRLFTEGSSLTLRLHGRISHLLEGFQAVDGKPCAQISMTIDLSSPVNEKEAPSNVEWKGTGHLLFDFEAGFLRSASFEIAKKTEADIGKNRTPSSTIEYFSIEVGLDPGKTARETFEKLRPINRP
jgi:hypothetical protein